MRIPDTELIRPLLVERHVTFAEAIDEAARREIAPREEPADDAGARREARSLLEWLGAGGWLDPIQKRDWRSCCLAREALAAASPLADAVYALQGLGTLPVLSADNRAMREPWVDAAMKGRAMAAFAMTEPEAGSDVASMATTARRDGDDYVIDGRKVFISNAGIADFYTVFAATDPAARAKGISCFVVPADRPGLRFVREQVLSSPHPLGEIEFQGCRVPASHRLGDEGRGMALGLATLDRLRSTVGAAACGMAARALDEAVTHA